MTRRSETPRRRSSRGDALHDRVEDAAVFLHLREPRRHRPAVAEQPLKHDARIGFVRERRVGRPPGRRVQVRAAVAGLAVADLIVRFERQLERPQRRVGAQLVGGILVDGLRARDVGAFGALRQHSAQPPGMIPRVDAAALVVGEHRHVAQAAHDDDVLAQRLDRLEHGRHRVVRAAVSFGMEVRQEHPVGHVDEAQAQGPGAGRCGRERRHHGIQERQRNRGAHAAQEGSAFERELRDDHRFTSSILRCCGTTRLAPTPTKVTTPWMRSMLPGPACPVSGTGTDSS